ncbi:GNAT family N-acetyltransferase [Nocardia sp. 2YAB30]|uniref:GNAT family N-acetyltransferase n=1 Tax=unclassified Nocardia TaxID=2637762 RepID=UPI003F99767C
MSVTIRPRTTAGLDGCATALRKVHEVDGYPAQWPADPVGWLSPSKLIAALVAEQDGAVVGHVGIGGSGEMPPAVRDMAGAGEIASVIRLYVVPDARRAGVGSRLLSAGVRRAEMRGLRSRWNPTVRRRSLCTNDTGGGECTVGRAGGAPPMDEKPGCITTSACECPVR